MWRWLTRDSRPIVKRRRNAQLGTRCATGACECETSAAPGRRRRDIGWAHRFGTQAVSPKFSRPGVCEPANSAIALRVALNRRKGARSWQYEVDQAQARCASSKPRYRRPLSPHCTAHLVASARGRAKGSAREATSRPVTSEINSNVNRPGTSATSAALVAVPCCRDSAAISC